uniref:Uncharacterized protein n=1 Tax=Proboscia inermis TaxID=420281 RepID=A0A7S0GEL5_9STRA|mmetsp:Transcript_27423/g.27815  ORF Transcript_27423/g.27815 Transcript_27423/m.27815 type:complete len:124 (+) Transcript_27423:579-950(+)
MEEMEQLRLGQDEEGEDNEDNFMEDACRTVSKIEEESQDEKKEESASELGLESSQLTAPEMDQILMCDRPLPAVSHVERQLETCSTAKLQHLLSLGLSASFAMSRYSRLYQAICVQFRESSLN